VDAYKLITWEEIGFTIGEEFKLDVEEQTKISPNINILYRK